MFSPHAQFLQQQKSDDIQKKKKHDYRFTKYVA